VVYDTRIRYLASVFLDANSIRATARAIAKVVDVLDDDNLLPITIEEQTLIGPSIPRLGFRSVKGDWLVTILGERFDVAHLPLDTQSSNMVDFAEFCEIARQHLSKLLIHFERKAHRIAAVEEGFLPEMSAADNQALMARLANLPPTFAEYPPFEWDWHLASRVPRLIGTTNEETNTILTARRRAGTLAFPEQPEWSFDRIRLDVDVNTSPANAVARFGETEVGDFFARTPGWHRELTAEFVSFVNVGSLHE
jgi:hypothetical protein